MLDPELIEEWKSTWGSIFAVEIRGQEYIFRAATFGEYKDATTQREDWSSAEAEDKLVAACLLYPKENFDRLPAGVITALAEEIIVVSGVGDPRHAKGVIEAKREEALGVEYLMKAFIIATMPTYNDADLDNYTFEQLAMKVALAEKILEVKRGNYLSKIPVTLEIIDPEEEAARLEAERTKHATQQKPGQAGFDDPIARKLHQALG